MKKTCGLDVHKDTIFCAVYHGEKYGKVTEFLTAASSTYEPGEALQAEGVMDVAMESTGIYWIPVWNILEQLPFKSFGMNQAYYYLLVIAHFMFETYKRDITPNVILVTVYPDTFRGKLTDFEAIERKDPSEPMNRSI